MAEVIKEAKNKVEWVREEETAIYGEPTAREYCERDPLELDSLVNELLASTYRLPLTVNEAFGLILTVVPAIVTEPYSS